jgi:hypothetical protein
MKARDEKNEAEKEHDRRITGIPRSNNYAVIDSDILLAMERVLNFPHLPSGED